LPAKKAVAIPAAGTAAPSFSAITDAGETLRLSALRGRWVILFFYPKDDTSG
jgi:thioredoxin-dependent peroxiredoxin